MPVGLFGPETFGAPETHTVGFRAGDKLMLFTDGLVDLKHEDGSTLEEAGVARIFQELVNAPTKEAECHILKRIKSLQESSPHDDLLLILVDLHSGASTGISQ
jgi:serine phosphatase RsbU (regulator of sigma subunit)